MRPHIEWTLFCKFGLPSAGHTPQQWWITFGLLHSVALLVGYAMRSSTPRILLIASILLILTALL